MTRYLECSNDEAVVRALGIPGKLTHEAGSGEVANALKKAESPCIAMVDEDPMGTVPSYLKTFVEEDRGDGLILKKHPKQGHRLVVVMPDLEPWLLKVAKGAGIPPEKFQLPSKANQLHQIGPNQRLRFSKWITAMVEAGAPGLVRLKKWLE